MHSKQLRYLHVVCVWACNCPFFLCPDNKNKEGDRINVIPIGLVCVCSIFFSSTMASIAFVVHYLIFKARKILFVDGKPSSLRAY